MLFDFSDFSGELETGKITMFQEDVFQIDFEHEIIGEKNAEGSGLAGAYGTYFGDKNKLFIPEFILPWENIPSVLSPASFRHCKGNNSLVVARQIVYESTQDEEENTRYGQDGATNLFQIFDIQEGVFIDETVLAIRYTKSALEAGMPVIFGVNFMPCPTTDFFDGSTNHHVVIVGMGYDGRNFFYAWDIGRESINHVDEKTALNGISVDNKLYIDTVWPGLVRADRKWDNSFSKYRQPYKVTQIIKHRQ